MDKENFDEIITIIRHYVGYLEKIIDNIGLFEDEVRIIAESADETYGLEMRMLCSNYLRYKPIAICESFHELNKAQQYLLMDGRFRSSCMDYMMALEYFKAFVKLNPDIDIKYYISLQGMYKIYLPEGIEKISSPPGIDLIGSMFKMEGIEKIGIVHVGNAPIYAESAKNILTESSNAVNEIETQENNVVDHTSEDLKSKPKKTNIFNSINSFIERTVRRRR